MADFIGRVTHILPPHKLLNYLELPTLHAKNDLLINPYLELKLFLQISQVNQVKLVCFGYKQLKNLFWVFINTTCQNRGPNSCLRNFSSRTNIICDSAYSMFILQHLQKHILNPPLTQEFFPLFCHSHLLLCICTLFISHVRSHNGLPEPLTLGNSQADSLVMLSLLEQAHLSHDFFHPNGHS